MTFGARHLEVRSTGALLGLLTQLCDPGTPLYLFPQSQTCQPCNTRRQDPAPSFTRQHGRWLGDGLARAGTESCWRQSSSETLLQGQQQLQPAWVTQCSQVTGVSPAGCSSGCCGAAAGCGEGPGGGCAFCHLTRTTRRKRAKQPKLSELESEGLRSQVSWSTNARHTWTASPPPL